MVIVATTSFDFTNRLNNNFKQPVAAAVVVGFWFVVVVVVLIDAFLLVNNYALSLQLLRNFNKSVFYPGSKWNCIYLCLILASCFPNM